jgi:hypothetical protein
LQLPRCRRIYSAFANLREIEETEMKAFLSISFAILPQLDMTPHADPVPEGARPQGPKP